MSAKLFLILFIGAEAASEPHDERHPYELLVDKESSINFTLEHKVHSVEGLSSGSVTGGAWFNGADAEVRVRVPVKSFDTGNRKRDDTMREVLEAERFPYIDLTGQVPNGKGAVGKKRFIGRLVFHGVARNVSVPVTLKKNGNGLAATATFKVSLDAHGIERPSLMSVKVSDALSVTAEILFRNAPR